MNISHAKTLLTFAAAALTGLASLTAQTHDGGQSISRSYGSGQFSGRVTAFTNGQSYDLPPVTFLGQTIAPSPLPGAQRAPRASHAHSGVTAHVRMLGLSFEGAAIDAQSLTTDGFELQFNGTTVHTVDSAKHGDLEVRIGGFSRLRVNATDERSWDRSFGPYNVSRSDIRRTFFVGPIPITVRGNLGARASIELATSLDAAALSAGITGGARAYGNGWARAGTGATYYGIGAEAGISATLRFADAVFVAVSISNSGRFSSTSGSTPR